ncbi:MAG: helix-turn-helix domain-containing protein [Candidatus Faecousia sp.]|nr:helix-turn-helix domain-containing protein [Candidatus Faecousia sp.]
MGIKTGEAIRAARTGAKLTQAALAKAVGLTPGEIGKAERGELELSKEALKAVAKAAGVTQTSLLNAEQAPKAEKAPKKESGPLKLTAAETKLIKLYRKATPEQKSDINRILNGEKTEVEQLVDALLGDKWKKKVKRK